ncbi:MAG TPA: META domain-containing protein [Jiangellales bacterium]|nr:META domain-containing protein [Jiangellales bacterium]
MTRLVAVIAAGTVLALAADRSTTSTLVFGDDRFLTGNTGCNSFRGSYEVEDGLLSADAAATTRAACASPDAERQEGPSWPVSQRPCATSWARTG